MSPRLSGLLALSAMAVLIVAGTVPATAQSPSPVALETAATAAPSSSPAGEAALERPEWFSMEMTDVRTGAPFTIDDFAGKVVLLETMAIWCPTCREQGDEVRRLHELLADRSDLVSISLDTDMGEDAAMLKTYADKLGYDWHHAVAPLLVARALGNLYSAQYLNPPLSPMLIIDRDGEVYSLPFGSVKSAASLQEVLAPFLDA
jgi:hypothetical protein